MADSTILNTITKADGTTVTAASEAASKQATQAGGALDKNAFLKLLVTQMEYQDPLDPADNSEYLAQLAQFSSLEQMTNVAEAMSALTTTVDNLNTSVLVGQLSNMIGKDVQWAEQTTTAEGKTGNVFYEGEVQQVSISDGTPSLVVKAANGSLISVAISKLTRIG